VSDDVASHDILLITHPEVRRDPKMRAAADFLKQLATEPPDSTDNRHRLFLGCHRLW
jgi:hypothetical protein